MRMRCVASGLCCAMLSILCCAWRLLGQHVRIFVCIPTPTTTDEVLFFSFRPYPQVRGKTLQPAPLLLLLLLLLQR